MMHEAASGLAALSFALAFVACAESEVSESSAPLVERVLSQEQRAKLTPDEVLLSLKEGNLRFVSGTLTSRDHSKRVRETAYRQSPMALILSCVDSRIPVADVFDQGIGSVFVARVAGNFENADILGSMEYACKVSSAKVVLVMGHERCGAVTAAIDGAALGNITPMLENIKPAVESVSRHYKGERTSANPEFLHMVAEENVRLTIADIRKRSPILKAMEGADEIKIVGALYDMNSGAVSFLE